MQKFFTILAAYLIGVFLGGYAIATLWGWFIVPIGVRAISFAQAAGLQTLLLLAMGSRGANDKPFDATRTLLIALLHPTFALGVGFCTHWIMLYA